MASPKSARMSLVQAAATVVLVMAGAAGAASPAPSSSADAAEPKTQQRPAYWIARSRNCASTPEAKAALQEYAAIVTKLLPRHPFVTLSRGASADEVEGNAHFDNYYLHRFPSREAALAFYHDPDYQKAIAIRARACETEVVIVDGLDAVTP